MTPAAGPVTGIEAPARAEWLARVGSEIVEEARRQRAAGAFPPSVEQRLDQLFAGVAPEGAAGQDAEEALRLVERSVTLDIDVPLRSRLPGGGRLKWALRQLIAWYLNYLLGQLNRFTAAIAKVLGLVHGRITVLEEQAKSRLPTVVPPAEAAPDLSCWSEVATAVLTGVSGLVLHLECGRGELLGALAGAGLDAYGIDPRGELLDQAVRAGLDVRGDDPVAHLLGLAPASLAGLVLSGFVDRLALGGQAGLAHLAATRLKTGAALVLIGRSPTAWGGGTAASVVEADLAPGRPLHPQTWAHLLSQAGLEEAQIQLPPAAVPPGGHHRGDPLGANLALLEDVLATAASFAVVARRPGQRD